MSKVGLALALALLGCGCHDGVVTEPGGRETPVVGATLLAPPRASFDRVADALVATCGTLDCHGQVGRNLRLYGNHGLRLSAKDDPGGNASTDEERTADYWSVVGLEPEVIDVVTREGGQNPERLILLRKARGTDKHKGGTLTRADDAFDRCLRAWLGGRSDEAACLAAVPKSPQTPAEP
jgi:hypothetical protein